MVVLVQLACTLLGASLVVSGASKVMSPGIFASALVHTYQLPRRLVPFVAHSIPYAEMLAGVLVLVPTTRHAGLLVGTGLLMIVTAAAFGALIHGRQSDCGCYGALWRENLSWHVVARATVLLMMSTTLFSTALIHPAILAGNVPSQLPAIFGGLLIAALLFASSWLVSVMRALEG